MNILGISCYYHDSAAVLLQKGEIIAAASEERFNRDKYSEAFPIHAANFCLQKGGITSFDLDYIGFYEKPALKFARVILNHVKSYPFSLINFMDTLPHWLQDRLIVPSVIKRELGYEKKIIFIKHHLSHAASAFLVSPFPEAAILTADGVGEQATTAYGVGRDKSIKIYREIKYPNSLGLLYAAVTAYLGFKVFAGEGKVMGLSSYGEPRYLNKFKQMVNVKEDGSFRFDNSFFGFNKGRRMYSRKFIKLFGEERIPESEIEQRHYDIAASLQKFVEEILLKIARNIHKETKQDNLCLGGGVFLNCVANNRLLEETPFKEIFIQPSAGDSGGALGVASYIYHSLLGNERNFVMRHAYLGPDYSREQIKRVLIKHNLKFKEFADCDLFKFTAKVISENKIVGWFQGRMEWGPRGLGNRSILANPCTPEMKELLNAKVKKRESFRPYAPAVLEEKADEFFQMQSSSPFMLLAPRVKKDKQKIIPAVTHIDGTARVQTVNKETNFKFWQLIKEFEKITGVPMLLNTSFNSKEEPIVCTPADAVSCFERIGLDCLILGNYIVER